MNKSFRKVTVLGCTITLLVGLIVGPAVSADPAATDADEIQVNVHVQSFAEVTIDEEEQYRHVERYEEVDFTKEFNVHVANNYDIQLSADEIEFPRDWQGSYVGKTTVTPYFTPNELVSGVYNNIEFKLHFVSEGLEGERDYTSAAEGNTDYLQVTQDYPTQPTLDPVTKEIVIQVSPLD